MNNELLKGYNEQKSILVEKINFFRRELVITADAGQKFSLKKNIENIEKELSEIDTQVKQLENNSSNPSVNDKELEKATQKIEELEKKIDKIANSPRVVNQYGEKSIYIEKNEGEINN